jgi:hypothetical protein
MTTRITVLIRVTILTTMLASSSCVQMKHKAEIDTSQIFMKLLREENYSDARKLLEEYYSNLEGTKSSLGITSNYLKKYGVPSPENAKVRQETLLGVDLIVVSYELTPSESNEKHTFVISIGKNKYKGKIVFYKMEHKNASQIEH